MAEPRGSEPARAAVRPAVRLGRLWSSFRWPFIGMLAVAVIVLGYTGFETYLEQRGGSLGFWDKLYFAIQLFPGQSGAVQPPIPASLNVARFLAPLVTVSAAAAAVLAIFREQARRARVRLFPRDVVVCGLGRTGFLLARGFSARRLRVVAIERDPENPNVGEAREAGVAVIVGDASDRTLLETARVDRADYLFAACGDDGLNAGVAIDALELVAGRRSAPLNCYVQVLDPGLAELLETEMAARTSDVMRLEFFNPSERGAAVLLNEHPPFDEWGTTPFGAPQPLMVGLGEMGSRLVVHMAGRWRATLGPGAPRLRVTVVDRLADSLVETLRLRHPHLDEVCELVARQTDLDTPEFARGDFLPGVTTVYVCVDDDARGLGAALRLRRRLGGRAVPIVVRTKRRGGLGTLVGETDHENIHVFGLLDLVCDPDVLLEGRTELLARAIHQDYVREQQKEGRTPAQNPSMVAWDDLPEHLKESNRRQADDIGAKVREIGCEIDRLTGSEPDRFAFSPEEIERLARREHDRWWRERESDGWTLAAEKDVERKRSPSLVAWEQLTEDVRELDRNAVRGIPAFLARAGYRVVRRGGP